MKKGRARRHRDARTLKQAGFLPELPQADRAVFAGEPCDECAGGVPGRPHADWCLTPDAVSSRDGGTDTAAGTP